MDFIKEKIKVMSELLGNLRILPLKEIDYEYLYVPEYKKSNTPPSKDENWLSSKDNCRFGGVDEHYWIHFTIDEIPKTDDRELRLFIKTSEESDWAPCNPQLTLFVDGVTTQAFDENHTWIALEYGKKYDVYAYLYTGMIGDHFDLYPKLIESDLKTEKLYFDVNVPFLCMKELSEDSYDYIKIRDSLDKALMLLDLRVSYSDDYYKGIDNATKYLKEEFYEKVCGHSDAIAHCIGHTHVDVAWLWTVMQTREKTQRSFSTVCNLMKRYKDYKFMSSQPQLYQFIKEDDPALYEEIKKYVKDGRWEVEGAMWLEADTNLVSGESLIRQILHGKRFMREEFGVESRMLWLPDVFGYSAALPQIMKKSGIDRFFTTKIYWNETNPFPHDVFMWEGIDGSSIFSSFRKEYNIRLNPQQLVQTWSNYKNKSLTNRTLITFGFGDGGGGPTAEMVENHERLKYGIPGIPKTVITTAKEFYDEVEKDFNENTKALKKTPKWVGELYLEMHRGTYTSMAKNKKFNRQSELLIMEAETLSALDMMENKNGYPVDIFNKNMMTVLLNQFHDIIPGSSIKEVYEVTDREYEEILESTKSVINEKLLNIAKSVKTDGGLFVYNPSPFEVSDTIYYDDKYYDAKNIPAHGWRVIKDEPCDLEISVSEKVIENDLIKVTFDDNYEISSVFDKEFQREVLAPNETANRLEVYEDYPRDFDAWEITDYYKQKMWIADNVDSVIMLDNGIKIRRIYGQSVIEQKITLNKNSKRIDFDTMINWKEDHVLLKASFPVDIRSQRATYDIQFGNIERPTHENTSWDAAKFEVCAHKWADLSESDYGVSILNDSKYGYSIEGNVMKLSLLKAATYPNTVADREIHTFTYSMYPHGGDFKTGKTIKEGYKLNMPLDFIKIEKNDAKLSDTYSIISSDKENIIVETLKKAEDTNDIIIRAYEAYNSKSEATITTGFDFKEVYLCDMMENNIKKLQHCGKSVKVNFKNFEINTLKFVI